MIIAASAVAAIARTRQVMRRHAIALGTSLLSATGLAGTAVVATLDELDGDPWPLTAIAVIAGLLAASMLGSLVVLLSWSAARAVIDALRVNRDEIERVEKTLALARAELAAVVERADELAGMVEQLDEQINRAYQQGRADAEAQWRIREQHLRDQLRADLERAVEEAHQAALQRGIEIGRAQRMQEEETERRERFGLGPDVIDAIQRIHRRVNGES